MVSRGCSLYEDRLVHLICPVQNKKEEGSSVTKSETVLAIIDACLEREMPLALVLSLAPILIDALKMSDEERLTCAVDLLNHVQKMSNDDGVLGICELLKKSAHDELEQHKWQSILKNGEVKPL